MYNFLVRLFWKSFEMSQSKIGANLTPALFPAAGLYLSWWLLEEVGELVAGIAFVVLCVNYLWIMRNLRKSGE
tara:strand:+ start:290 stop:508 length:219 start_codon:yes stop_codon:yes gene_type:complete